MAAKAQTSKPGRLVSIDAVRGLTVLLMIFMDHTANATALAAGPFAFLVHPHWHGFKLPDSVFPAFIFIAGVSMAFSTRGLTSWAEMRKAAPTLLRRIALLFALGLALNWAKYGLPLRYMGVLQRIALATLVAWPLLRLRPRTLVATALAMLAVHTALLLWVPAGSVTPGGWVAAASTPEAIAVAKHATIAGWLDRGLLGVAHTYKGSGFDPEGLLGVLSSAAQMLLGLAFGKLLAGDARSGERLPALAAGCAAMLAAGLALSPWVPLNKYLWTSTFVLVSSAACGVAILAFYLAADAPGRTRLLGWLVPTGRNALALYIASNVLIVGLRYLPFTAEAGRFHGIEALGRILEPALGGAGASLALSAAQCALWMAVAWALDRKRVYIKL